jgi:hypothetical protein
MNDNFGKRTTGKGNSNRGTVLLFLLIVLVLVLAYLARDAYGSLGPQAPLLLVSGMLGNPFRTTRRMKVPFHSRVGHRERAYLGFAKLVFGLCIGLLVLFVVAGALSLIGG